MDVMSNIYTRDARADEIYEQMRNDKKKADKLRQLSYKKKNVLSSNAN